MKTEALPATVYSATCDHCKLACKYIRFESSFYDFDTYWGAGTGTWYRVNRDLTAERYGTRSIDELLGLASAREGGSEQLQRVPDQLQCQHCHRANLQTDHMPGVEQRVQAVTLP